MAATRTTWLVLALALLAAPLGGCAGLPGPAYHSAQPAYTVHYPPFWTVHQDQNDYGPLTTFSPDATPGPGSTRITLQHVSGGSNFQVPDQHQALDVAMTEDLGRDGHGLHGERICITKGSSGYMITFYAPPWNFDTIRDVADRMAKELNPSVTIRH